MTGEEAGSAERRRGEVRQRYGSIAARPDPAGCCGGSGTSGGCGCGDASAPGACCSEELGYSPEDLARLPPGADLGLGCGNPTRLADLRPGEVVLDLGSGGGIDCFLAADRVGSDGRVIGVDMTPEMVARARGLARSSGRKNVEFRLGEIEHLPLADGSVDVVLSNCVINLAPDQREVYRDAFRVLRPGGRLSISDVIATRPIPPEAREDADRWTSCSAGAISRDELVEILGATGFVDVEVSVSGPTSGPGGSLENQRDLGVYPGTVRASKPIPP